MTRASKPRLTIGWLALAAVCFLGGSLGAWMMYMAWQHNPQGEFHEPGVIHWVLWLTIGLSWFAFIAGIPCLIGMLGFAISRFQKSR
jgi:hypothetical protein